MDISYAKTRSIPRDDAFGRATGWIAEHPLIAGLLGGIGAVAIAAVNAPGGVANAPGDALILSVIVIVTWLVLVYFLRSFFENLSTRDIREEYSLEYDEQRLVWKKEEETLAEIEEPTLTLRTIEVDEFSADDEAWPVWLVAEGRDGRFVLETKVTAGEAKHYEGVDPELTENTDEQLPTHVASALLQEADRRLEG